MSSEANSSEVRLPKKGFLDYLEMTSVGFVVTVSILVENELRLDHVKLS